LADELIGSAVRIAQSVASFADHLGNRGETPEQRWNEANVIRLSAMHHEVHAAEVFGAILQIEMVIVGPKAAGPETDERNSSLRQSSEIVERRAIVCVPQ
jgi:hypothetical protein